MAVRFPKQELKIKLDFGSALLDSFLLYVFSNSVEPVFFSRMYDLFKKIDSKVYEDSADNQYKFNMIKKVLEGRVEKKINNPVVLAAYVGRDDLQDELRNGEDLLDPGSIVWCNNVITSYLKSQEIYRILPEMKELIDKIEKSKEKPMENIKVFEKLAKITQDVQESINVVNLENDFFSLQDDVFEKNIHSTYERLMNPATKLLTGMQGMNILLGGGLELGRHYMFFGLPGEGKSALLLNLVNQIRMSNPRYIGKDPTKIPTIVYITQENSIVETEERLFNICGCPGDMIDYPREKVIDMMRDIGHMYLDDEININMVIRYVDPFMISTSYFRDLYCEMSERGMEVILVAHDYVQKIHSEDENVRRDMRLELAQIVAEECSFAKSFDVAFLTVAQLNRDASSKVDTAKNANAVDILYSLNRQNIAESMAMINHTDGAYIILNEHEQTNKKNFLGVQKIKLRNKVKEDFKIIYLPCASDCRIRLLTDLNSAPIFKTSLQDLRGDESTENRFQNKHQPPRSTLADIASRPSKNPTVVIDDESKIKQIIEKRSAQNFQSQPQPQVQDQLKQNPFGPKWSNRTLEHQAPPPIPIQPNVVQETPKQLIDPPWNIVIREEPKPLIDPPWKIVIKAPRKEVPCPWNIVIR